MKRLLIVLLLAVGFNCYAADSTRLEIISSVNPDAYYPSFSKRNGEEGTAACRIVFGKDGTVIETVIIKSAGYPRLDRAALDMCRRIRIKPFIINNEPTFIQTEYAIKFTLTDSVKQAYDN